MFCRERALLINDIVFDTPLYDWLWSKKKLPLKSYDSLLKCPKNGKTHPLDDKSLWCRFPQVLKGLFCENAIFWMFWKDFQRRPANSVEFHWIALDSMDFQVLHGIPWKPIGFHGMPWISMDFYGIPWKSIEIHGIPKCSMKFDGFPWNFIDFRGIPWNSLEFTCIFSMRFN